MLIVWDALIAWRDDVLQKDLLRGSRVIYLCHMGKLIEKRILDIEQPLSEFIKIIPSNVLKAIENTTEWTPSTKKCRKIQFQSFYKFVQENEIKKTDIVIPFKEFRNLETAAVSELLSSNEIKAQSQSLTKEDILRFLEELCVINARDSLVCWMSWEFKAAIFQVLELKISDIDFEEGSIQFKDGLRLSPSGGIHPGIGKCIIEQSKGKQSSDLLFSTSQGSQIHPGQIVRNMKKASKISKLPIILSPKILYAHAKAYSEKVFQEMTEEEKKNLSVAYRRKLQQKYEKVKKTIVT